MQPKEKGKYSVIIASCVLLRVFYLFYQEYGLSDFSQLLSFVVICLIPAAMMVYPNLFSRTVLGWISFGGFGRFATDAKAPEHSAFAIKILGYIALALIYAGIESSM